MKIKKISNLVLSTAITIAFADSACNVVNGTENCEKASNECARDSTNKLNGDNGIVPASAVKGTPLNAIYF